MKAILDKILIIIFCMILQLPFKNKDIVIIIFIVSVIIGASQFYFENLYYKRLSTTIFLFLCIIRPEFSVLSPLIAYEFNIDLVDLLFQAILLLNVILNSNIKDSNQIILIILFFVAIELGEKNRKIIDFQNKVCAIRDDSEENKRILIRTNRDLLEKQDQEIYLTKLKERNRIAREIHDNVGHMISRSILQVGALKVIIKENNIKNALIDIQETLDIAMNNVRESVHDLHDESVDLEKTIIELIQPLNTKMKVSFDYEVEGGMSREIKYSFIGIIKEAVANVIKHSTNEIFTVGVYEHPSMYQLVIWDKPDGTIKKSKKTYVKSTAGIGLLNMENRIESLKGTIHFNDDIGFKIFISIPKTVLKS